MRKHKNNTRKRASRYHLAQLRHLRKVRALYEHNAATGIALIFPFATIVIISILYRLSLPESDQLAQFYESWVFSPAVVVLWAVVFPTIALLINIGSLTTIIRDHRYNGKIRIHALLQDVWPSLAIVLLVLTGFAFVFGGGIQNITSNLQGI